MTQTNLKKIIASFVRFMLTMYFFTCYTSCKLVSGITTNMLLVDCFQPDDVGLYAASQEDRDWHRENVASGVITQHTITAKDGANLRAIQIANVQNPSKRIILSVHGWSKCAYTQTFKYGKIFYNELGTTVFLPDLRNHGKSEGTVTGWGTFDAKDIAQWVDYLVDLHGTDCEIILHGLSLGAITVLSSVPQINAPQVKCVISDGTVTNFYDLITCHIDILNQAQKAKFLQNMQEHFNKTSGAYNLANINLHPFIKDITLPVLFVHTAKDGVSPKKLLMPLYEEKPYPKELFILPRGQHDRIIERYPKEYIQKAREFIDKYTSTR